MAGDTVTDILYKVLRTHIPDLEKQVRAQCPRRTGRLQRSVRAQAARGIRGVTLLLHIEFYFRWQVAEGLPIELREAIRRLMRQHGREAARETLRIWYRLQIASLTPQLQAAGLRAIRQGNSIRFILFFQDGGNIPRSYSG